MSSQFSYELDERQIKILMINAQVNYNEDLWHKFEQIEANKPKVYGDISNALPKINVGISRSIIVPIIFITLIGGLSALLFSFVDNKKKQAIETEVPYIAVVKPISKPVIKPKIIIKPKQVIVTNTVAVIDSIVPKTTTVTAEPIAPIKKEEPVTKIAEAKPIIKEIPAEQKKEKKAEPVKKKRKLKRVELPIITAAPNLNEGSSEPELELK